jgi:peptide subunit release factor 1 (eRF1)
MLDELLGRAALKERIEELEAERDSLADQLAAEQRRRSDAASDRQEADERVNRLEDRIAQLEGELERVRETDGDGAALEFRATAAMGRERTATVLDRLESVAAPPEGALTAAVSDGSALPEAVREAFGERAALVSRAAPCVAVADDAGLVSAALRPPIQPPDGHEWAPSFDLDRERFLPTDSHAVALLRADVFAVGEYDGAEQVAFEGFESDVQGSHSKGGFSQARFERLRDEQVDRHLARCREALADVSADRLYLVGDEAALEAFDVDADARATVDATGDPEAALADAVRSFWTTRLFAI